MIYQCEKNTVNVAAETNTQLCDHCAPKLFERYGYDVADVGECSQCQGNGECLDVALIEFYRKNKIDDETIYTSLPRVRKTVNKPMITWDEVYIACSQFKRSEET